MANNKVSIPKGTRDFSPIEMVKRNHIFSNIRNVFIQYGYQPIETPAMENLSTLLGKYGEEGDKLLFRILNSGEYTKKIPEEIQKELYKTGAGESTQKLNTYISEKGLRYDLTVPFARFVVQNQGKIHFPFKRYQIQPVWRADKPQKGRYREFYQCDADIIGSNSLINEVELMQIIDEVFTCLKINITIKINNRKILAGLARKIGAEDKLTDITIAMDKLDKIGEENVRKELIGKNLTNQQTDAIINFIKIEGSNGDKMDALEKYFSGNEMGLTGVQEIKKVFDFVIPLKLKNKIEIDVTLARGLNYYTGAIIEVKANDMQIGSISGGGRYDDLTGIFGMPGVSGVGISFGADRIYDVLDQLNLFPENLNKAAHLMFVNFGDKEAAYCLPLIQKLHKNGYNAFLYPDAAKMKKQLSYANQLNIPYVALAGENEINDKVLTIKNMIEGTQKTVSVDNLNEIFS